VGRVSLDDGDVGVGTSGDEVGGRGGVVRGDGFRRGGGDGRGDVQRRSGRGGGVDLHLRRERRAGADRKRGDGAGDRAAGADGWGRASPSDWVVQREITGPGWMWVRSRAELSCGDTVTSQAALVTYE